MCPKQPIGAILIPIPVDVNNNIVDEGCQIGSEILLEEMGKLYWN